MKKFLCTSIVLLLVLTLTSCDGEFNIDELLGALDEYLYVEEYELITDSSSSDGTIKDRPSTDTAWDTDEETRSPDPDDGKDDPANKDNDGDKNNGSDGGSTDSGKVNNGIVIPTYKMTLSIPENIKFIGTENATVENKTSKTTAMALKFSLDGEIINWISEGDIIYVITEGNNRLVVIDSEKMVHLYNVPLSGVPAEINIIGEKIYISFPDLCRIDIFSKTTHKKESSIYFDHEVSSFCLDGDYIYYSEHDQHCEVFKKDLVTDKEVAIDNGKTFYEPKLCLNKEDRILYIGETNSSGCDLFYYDADTLQQKSVFEKDDYGIPNNTREIFHVGDVIYWGYFCISDTNARELIGQFGSNSYGTLAFASEDAIITTKGIYLPDTYECIVNYDDFSLEYKRILISESGNVFLRSEFYGGKEIIGINFDRQ